ncbi:uncharacterized protein LOC142355054, partial [Convolutriloba macropyga]|uniref:uncharacterized protein LOC142355054 n=1 Tax=Convolutriloba macropyga TaxID=536237 RepID=UPI003F51D4B1
LLLFTATPAYCEDDLTVDSSSYAYFNEYRNGGSDVDVVLVGGETQLTSNGSQSEIPIYFDTESDLKTLGLTDANFNPASPVERKVYVKVVDKYLDAFYLNSTNPSDSGFLVPEEDAEDDNGVVNVVLQEFVFDGYQLVVPDLNPTTQITDIVELWLVPIGDTFSNGFSLFLELKGCTDQEPKECEAFENPDALEPTSFSLLIYNTDNELEEIKPDGEPNFKPTDRAVTIGPLILELDLEDPNFNPGGVLNVSQQFQVPAISFKTTDKYKITTVRIGYEHGYKKVDEKENPDGTTTILEDIILELTPNGEERVTMLSNLTAGNKTLRSNEGVNEYTVDYSAGLGVGYVNFEGFNAENSITTRLIYIIITQIVNIETPGVEIPVSFDDIRPEDLVLNDLIAAHGCVKCRNSSEPGCSNPCVGGIQELCVRVLDEDECDRTYCKRRDLMDLALSRNKTTFECLTYQERCVEAYHCRCENATDVFDLDGNCVEKRFCPCKKENKTESSPSSPPPSYSRSVSASQSQSASIS